MNKIFVLSLILFFGRMTYAQAFTTSIVILEKTFCRTASYQSGNGKLSYTVSGGVTPYQFNWIDPNNNSISNPLSVHEPGLYKLIVTDANGFTAKDSVFLDSINPTAAFSLQGGGLNQISSNEYIGFNAANVYFINNSTGFAQANNPISDTIFQWNLDKSPNLANSGSWFYSFSMNEVLNHNYLPGTYEALLIAKNYNDCVDTTAVYIGIFAPSAVDELDTENSFVIIPNKNNNLIHFYKKGFDEGLRLNIYSMNGQKIEGRKIFSSSEEIHFNQASGIYIYELFENQTKIATGKLNF